MFCYTIGDDDEAQQRIVAMAMDGAFESLGAVSKYADDVADLTDDTFGSVYKKKTAFESSEYVDDIVRNTDVKQPKNTDVVEEITDNLDEVVDELDDVADEIITDGSHLDNGKLKSNVKYKTGDFLIIRI